MVVVVAVVAVVFVVAVVVVVVVVAVAAEWAKRTGWTDLEHDHEAPEAEGSEALGEGAHTVDRALGLALLLVGHRRRDLGRGHVARGQR